MVRTRFNKYFLNWNKCILKMHFISKKTMKNALRLRGIKLTWQYDTGSQLNSELPLWSQKLYTPTRRLIRSILVTYCWIIISTFKPTTAIYYFSWFYDLSEHTEWVFCYMWHWLRLQSPGRSIETFKVTNLHVWQFSNGCWLGAQLRLLSNKPQFSHVCGPSL